MWVEVDSLTFRECQNLFFKKDWKLASLIPTFLKKDNAIWFLDVEYMQTYSCFIFQSLVYQTSAAQNKTTAFSVKSFQEAKKREKRLIISLWEICQSRRFIVKISFISLNSIFYTKSLLSRAQALRPSYIILNISSFIILLLSVNTLDPSENRPNALPRGTRYVHLHLTHSPPSRRWTLLWRQIPIAMWIPEEQ